VASKFASFHLRFCDMAWLLLWSIDKKCWYGEGGSWAGGWLRSLCLTFQFVCMSLCKSTYTHLVQVNALRLTVSKPHGSTVYFWYMWCLASLGNKCGMNYCWTLFLHFFLIRRCKTLRSTSAIINPRITQIQNTPLYVL
jgi:hypothetical protein